MEKLFKLTSNSLLTVFLFGLMLLPIVSMGFMGFKPNNQNVLSAQDEKVCPTLEQLQKEVNVGEIKQTTESTEPELLNLE
jgi:hypothetical protein